MLGSCRLLTNRPASVSISSSLLEESEVELAALEVAKLVSSSSRLLILAAPATQNVPIPAQQ